MLRYALLLVLALATFAAAQEAAGKFTYPDALRQLTDLDRLWQPPHPQARCIQFASFEPDSRKGIGIRESQPGDPKGWYANHDRGHYLREETRAGTNEWVLADCEGPGVVVRIWSANPAGTLFFYLDGASEPTWSADFKALTHGLVEPFTEPLAGMRGRGCNFHAPIPFAKRVVVTCSKNNQYFQVNVRRLPQGTAVESFRPELIDKHAAVIAATRALLAGGPELGELPSEGIAGRIAMTGDPRDPADHVERGVDLQGPLVIRELSLEIGPPPAGLTRAAQLRRLLLSVDFEGRRTVRVPVADFFGSAPGFQPYRTYPMEVTADGRGVCRLPIPVAKRARIALVADGPLPATRFNLRLRVDRRPVPKDALTLHASWHLKKRIRTRPFSDFLVLNAIGPGRFVGCSLVIANRSRIWWGEGDEKFFVDGERFPSTFGTGTEDYFGYAWGDRSLFKSAFHAQPQCDGPGNFGYSCVNRFQLPDAVPFQQSFLFDLEIWHWRDVHVDYATTAWWYGLPGARSGLPTVPPAAARTPDPLSEEDGFTARHAVEAEAMKVVAISAGKCTVQNVGWYDDRDWSGGKQRWWRGGKVGDKLTLGLPVAAAGRYRVEVVLTRAPDYGVVRIGLNESPLGEPIDLFTPHVVMPTRRLLLGEVELEQGEAKLTLEVTGKNPRARGHMVGIDYLRLVPMR